MENMREMLRRNLGRSLEALPELDRLTAAWPVACGTAMAAKGEVAGYEDGVLRVVVKNSVWLEQMRSMQQVLERELARIAEVKLTGIHFEVKRFGGRRPDGKSGPERVS
jgi:predicted nucleic acid-binding Zn ribbon protein